LKQNQLQKSQLSNNALLWNTLKISGEAQLGNGKAVRVDAVPSQ